MNNSEHELVNSEVNHKPTGRKRNSAIGRKPRVRTRKAASGSPATNPETENEDGGTRLRNAVERQVGKQSEEIAKALVDETIRGNMAGARLVTELSGAKTARPKRPKTSIGPSWAERLAAQTQWVDPVEADNKADNEGDNETDPAPNGQPF